MADYISVAITSIVDSGAADTPTTSRLVDVDGTFVADVTIGDLVYNTTDSTFALVSSITSDEILVLDADIMAYNEDYQIHSGTPVDSGTCTATSAGELVEAGQNFLTTVTIGDVVTNTTTGAITTVVSVDSDTTLTLTDDIMLDTNTFIIYPLARLALGTQSAVLQDAGQNFLTTVTVGDTVRNTTDGTFAFVTGVLLDTLLGLSGDIMANAEAYTIYANTGTNPQLIGVQGVLLVEQTDSNTVTITYDGGAATDIVTISHDTQASGVGMRDAFQRAIELANQYTNANKSVIPVQNLLDVLDVTIA